MQSIPASSQEKGITIGVIGPEALVERILRVMLRFPSFKPIPRFYKQEEEAALIAEELAGEAEVLLISGPMSYRRIREETDIKIPIHYVPLTDTGFYQALWRLKNTAGLHGNAKVSIDSVSPQMVAGSLKEIAETSIEAVHYNGKAYPSGKDLASFHLGEYESGRCQAALTAEQSVARTLSECGVPCEWIAPTDQNIVVALERALLSTETRRMKEAQIVVGLLNVDHFGRHIQNQISEHEVQKFKLEIHRMLLDYVESLDGYLTHLGGDEYLFFTTRGIFERETGGYKSIPLARKAGKTFGLSLSIGIGFGRSANEAGTHARSALRKSKEAGGNTCFIVREDRTLIGPLEMADPIAHDLSVTDAELLQKAEAAGMTSEYLIKLLSRVARSGKTDFKVFELAAMLDITVRSTHRLLLQWIDNGLIDVVGMEKVPKGRPRQVYRLTFLADRIGL